MLVEAAGQNRSTQRRIRRCATALNLLIGNEVELQPLLASGNQADTLLGNHRDENLVRRKLHKVVSALGCTNADDCRGYSRGGRGKKRELAGAIDVARGERHSKTKVIGVIAKNANTPELELLT
jgi:hypothetical protein